jgi:signal transduction histidine kinase
VTTVRPHEVRRQSIRVALGAAAAVAIAYLVIATVVVVVVTSRLTSQIDDRLTSFIQGAPQGQQHHDSGGGGGDDDRPYGPPTLGWQIDPSGTATYIGPDSYRVDLPAALASITKPETVTINGSQVRMMGAQVGEYRIVVAQTMANVSDAQGTLLLAEALIGPVLITLVFLGAVVVGRRVATPIELARQRQLDFTADASHELRTPLSVIEAQTSLALNQARDVAWYRAAFERIDRESKRMRRLLDDLLWLARFDTTHAPPNVEPVDLGILAAQAADRFGVVAEARNLTLEVSGQEVGAVIAAPSDWLDRLLGVLLDNACKYSPEGGTVRVAVLTEAGRVRLTVDDSGPGIAEGERERIFDRFHRAIEGPAGAGLGLAIADAIVRATGGRWQVGRSPTDGARMAVTWPPAFGGKRDPAIAGSRSQAAGTD